MTAITPPSSTEIPSPYALACAAAATAQGLDPIVEALREAGLVVDVAQTGGFCMVAVVPCRGGVVAITDDGEFLVGAYPGTSWVDGDPVEYVVAPTLEEMTSQVLDDVEFLAGQED